MPTTATFCLWREVLRHIKDPSEREIERCRLTGMKSPISFHERKARRIAKMQGAA